jgi:glycosyltransferase involved in cell wall biosynthesis
MNILFLTISYPNTHDDHNMYTDLAQEFHSQGHKVRVATLLEAREGGRTYLATEHGIEVLRIRSGNFFKVSPLEKGLTMMRLARDFTNAILEHFSSDPIDLVIYPTPPITLGPVVKRLKRYFGCRTYLILRDIFPQNAHDLGLMDNCILFRYFRQMEKTLYDLSDLIGCMSEGNIKYVKTHNAVDHGKLHLLYNWKHEDLPDFGYSATLRDNKQVTAVFGGNLGMAQELDFLMDLIRLYRSRRDVRFLIAGDGTERERLKDTIEREGLDNVELLRRMPRRAYGGLLLKADIGLVTLDRRFTIPNFPSKTLSYFEAGLPVVAATDKHTDFGKFLSDVGAGLCSVTGDLEALSNNFEMLVRNPELRREMGSCGRQFFIDNLTVETAYQTIVDQVEALTN